MATWRILFLIEGLPSVALAGVIMLCLPSTPQKSRGESGSAETYILV